MPDDINERPFSPVPTGSPPNALIFLVPINTISLTISIIRSMSGLPRLTL